MSCMHFRVNLHSIVAWMSRNSLLKTSAKSGVWVTAPGLDNTTTYFVNQHPTISPNWPNDWAELWELIWTVHFTLCSCHVTYAFHSESTLYSCLNFKELFAQNRHKISSLSDCKWSRTHNHLVCKRTLNHLAKLTKSLSGVVSCCLHGVFDCMFLSYHVRVSEWIYTL